MFRRHRARRRVKRRRPRGVVLHPAYAGSFAALATGWVWIMAGAVCFVLRSRVDQVLLAWLAGPVLLYVALCRLAATVLRRGENRVAERLTPQQVRLAAVLFHLLVFIILYVLLVNPVAGWFLHGHGRPGGSAVFGTFMINFVIVQAAVTALARDGLITRIRSFFP